MIYTHDENVIVLYDRILHTLAAMECSSDLVIEDVMTKRLPYAGCSKEVLRILLELLKEIKENGN